MNAEAVLVLDNAIEAAIRSGTPLTEAQVALARSILENHDIEAIDVENAEDDSAQDEFAVVDAEAGKTEIGVAAALEDEETAEKIHAARIRTAAVAVRPPTPILSRCLEEKTVVIDEDDDYRLLDGTPLGYTPDKKGNQRPVKLAAVGNEAQAERILVDKKV